MMKNNDIFERMEELETKIESQESSIKVLKRIKNAYE
jgi:uncharacterized coiled-coil protein SlyX